MKHLKINWTTLIIAALGVIFCVLSAFRVTDVLCVTQGCTLYQDIILWGISFYWFGALAFFILLSIEISPYRYYLNRTAAVFVLLDIPFLFIQVLLWPCAHCLIVALFFGLIFYASLDKNQKWMNWLLGVWLLLFSVNVISVAKESLSPWPVYGDRSAQIQLYFSPSCPSCHSMLDALLAKGEMTSRIALYPIVKSASDIPKIMALEKRLKEGMPIQEALLQYQKDENSTDSDLNYYRVKFQTFRNLVSMSRYGATSVPFLVTQTPFWRNVKISQPVKDDCPVFSKNSQGLCVDEESSGVKKLFESRHSSGNIF